jgi:hypothetical protein
MRDWSREIFEATRDYIPDDWDLPTKYELAMDMEEDVEPEEEDE